MTISGKTCCFHSYNETKIGANCPDRSIVRVSRAHPRWKRPTYCIRVSRSRGVDAKRRGHKLLAFYAVRVFTIRRSHSWVSSCKSMAISVAESVLLVEYIWICDDCIYCNGANCFVRRVFYGLICDLVLADIFFLYFYRDLYVQSLGYIHCASPDIQIRYNM